MLRAKIFCAKGSLDAERRSAAASTLHVWIFKFEAGPFERLDVIHDAAVEIHDGGGIHEHLESVHLESFVHHSSDVFKLHGIGKAGAPASDDANAQACRHGRLLAHDLFDFGYRVGSHRNWWRLLYYFCFRNVRRHLGNGRRSHSYLLGSKVAKL